MYGNKYRNMNLLTAEKYILLTFLIRVCMLHVNEYNMVDVKMMKFSVGNI